MFELHFDFCLNEGMNVISTSKKKIEIYLCLAGYHHIYLHSVHRTMIFYMNVGIDY